MFPRSVGDCGWFVFFSCRNNIIFPTTEEACRVTEKEWCDTLEHRHNFPVITGTLTAGNGLAIEINKPTIRELKGSDVAGWMNRKGFFAIVKLSVMHTQCFKF